MDEASFLYYLTLFTFAVIGFFIYVRKCYTFFERNNIPIGPTPQWPFGNFEDVLFLKESFHLTILKHYNRFKRKKFNQGGIYLFLKPLVILVDLSITDKFLKNNPDKKLLKSGCFHSSITFNENHLKSINFFKYFDKTNAKKSVTNSMQISQNLKIYLEDLLRSSTHPVDLKEVMMRLQVDIWANIFFGVNTECLSNKDEDLYNIVTTLPECYQLKIFLKWCYPIFSTLTGINPLKHKLKKDFKLVFNSIDFDKINKDSFLYSLLQDNDKKKIDDKLIHVLFDFFINSVILISNVLLFCSFELSNNSDIQDELRGEIKRFLKSREESTIDKIEELTYLDTVVKETLRKYPACPAILTKCLKNHSFKNGSDNLTLHKNCLVVIPIYGIHHDQEYYHNPECFDPDRFSEENKNFVRPGSYLPFGYGFFNCIGKSLIETQIKISLIYLISSFNLKSSSKRKIEFTDTDFILQPKESILFKMEPC